MSEMNFDKEKKATVIAFAKHGVAIREDQVTVTLEDRARCAFDLGDVRGVATVQLDHIEEMTQATVCLVHLIKGYREQLKKQRHYCLWV